MAVLLLSAFLVFLTVANASPVAQPGANPVCIVGAGPGGLTIAHELEAKGYRTITFDKQPEVGGKCQAYYDGPDQSIYHPLGALLFTNATYTNTLPLIDAANLPLTPGITRLHWQFWHYGPGADASTVAEAPEVSPGEAALLAAEYLRYAAYWETSFAPRYTALRYTNGVPDDLTVPIGQWLSANGYVGLPAAMERGMVSYGYGDITQTPAIYMLQYFTPDVLGVFLDVTQSYIVDFHKVMVHYSTSVNGPIHVDAAVTKIDRTGPAPVITYLSSGLTQTQTCSDVVLAFAPNLRNLEAIDMPLSSPERTVFSKVGTTAYWSSATATTIDSQRLYSQVPPKPLGEPVSFLRLFEASPIATTYSWAEIGSTLSTAEVSQLLTSTITDVQTGANVTDPTVTAADVKALRRWAYFPHFGTADLASDVYAAYNALQGQNHTYYSSALDGFETVEFAIRAGKDLVERYF